MYAASLAATKKMGIKLKKKAAKRNAQQQPKWKEQMTKEIEMLRGELSILDELSKGNIIKTRTARKVKRKYKLFDMDEIVKSKELLKQKLQVKAQRIRRYEKRSNFYRHNKIFNTDAKKFYRQLGKETIEIKDPPQMQEVETFWKNIWSNKKGFNENAEWITREEARTRAIEEQGWEDITTKELSQA